MREGSSARKAIAVAIPRPRAWLAAALFALAAGCRGAIDTRALIARDGVDGTVRDLRFRLAADPSDRPALLALATVEQDRGHPGAALEALARAYALGRAPGTDFPGAARFASLLLARAEARVARGAPAAAADVELARALGAAPPPALRDGVDRVVGLAELRHADPATRARGAARLAALAGRSPDPRLVIALPPSPSAADLARAAVAASWLWDQGARRAAVDAFAAWSAAGGPAALARSPAPPVDGMTVTTEAILARAAAAKAWWSGAPAARPPELRTDPVAEPPADPAPEPVAEPVADPVPVPVPVPVADPVPAPDPVADPVPATASRTATPRLARAATARALRVSRLTLPAADTAALTAIATAYLRDPALGDRLADDWIASDLDVARRAPITAALFAALGDPARARALWQRSVAASPAEPALDRGLAVAAAAAADPDAALVFATGAAAESGDPAPVLIAVARHLAASGHHTHALEALKLALALSAPGADRDALGLAIASSRAIGRAGQADDLAAVLATRAAPPPEDDAVAAIAAAPVAERAARLAALAADPTVDDDTAARAWTGFLRSCGRACRAPAP